MALAGPVTKEFVLDQFDNAYEQKAVAVAELAAGVVAEWPTERPTERYTYLQSVPQMRRWQRGESREAKAFRAVSWTTDTLDYQVKVEWHRNDNRDHQGRRDVESKAQMAGESTGAMLIRLSTQVVESATNYELLPTIPVAPDGAAMHAATAGGADRFGRSGGNILTGSGVTGQDIRDDLFNSLEAFLAFLNTEGFPLWDPMILEAGVTVMYPIQLLKAMGEAFKWSRPLTMDDTGSPAVAAATTNLTQDAGVKIQSFVNPYLTDASDWYVFLNGSPVKPLYRGTHEPLQNDVWNRGNSDRSRDEKIDAVGWDARWSMGIGPCYQTIKINN